MEKIRNSGKNKQTKEHTEKENKAKQANKVRRVDRRTNALPDQPTDRPTDGHSQLQRCFVAPKNSFFGKYTYVIAVV